MRTRSAISPGLLQVSWAYTTPGLAAHALVLSMYLAAAALTLVLGLDRPEGWAVWPAASLGAGIGLGAVCRCGIGLLPTVAIAATVANLLSGVPVVQGVGVAASQVLMITVVIGLMRALSFTADLARFRDFLILVLMGPVLMALVSGLAAVLLQQGFAEVSAGSVARAWLAMATGCMLMAPLMLTVWPQSRDKHAGIEARGFAMVAVLVGLMLVSQMRGLPTELTTSISYAVLVTAAITAMFNSTRTVAIAVAAAGFAGAVSASLSFGPFDHAADADERLLVLISLCLLAFVGLAVSAVRVEHQRLFRHDSERLHRIARSGEAQAREDAETRIAGELNQPLTAIRTYAQTAARQLARELSEGDEQESLRRALQGIVSGTERAAATVRPRHGKPHLPQTDVAEFLHQSLRETSWEFASRRIRLRENIDPGLPPVLVPEAELERVVLLGLHISIELAVENGSQRGRCLQLNCAFDGDNGLVVIEFRTDAGRRRTVHSEASLRRNRDWRGWIERLDRFESEGGYFLLREEGGKHVVRIGLPAMLEAK